jgi:hypothetical protein
MDFGRWGFYLSVGSYLAVIPLAILANILTPKVQDRLARTSAERLKKRLLKLRSQIEHPPTLLESLAPIIVALPILLAGVLLVLSSLTMFLVEVMQSREPAKPVVSIEVGAVAVISFWTSIAAILITMRGMRILDFLKQGEENYQRLYAEEKSKEVEKLL